ncbi:MAG TPA: M1 family aminopeptidase [Bryobacteraceae bacterium]|nr:M1 family aminopeptidase [Bryobacteraceae bacterium]
MRAQVRGRPVMRWVMRIANCIVLSAIVPARAAPLKRMYTVENYDVMIQPDLAKQRLYGEARIRFHSLTDTDTSALELDGGGLQITSVLEGQDPQSFERNHSLLFVVLTKPLRPDEPRTITVRYEAGPAAGLKFFPDQVYTSATSDWMPCNDGPGERATLHLTIAAPADTKAAGSGLLTATRASEGRRITEWRLDSPTGIAWFGFALGGFTENTSDADDVKLRVLGAGSQIFEPTAAVLKYLAERTGKHYPGQTYTQVFVHSDVSRSLAGGLTLLPESYAQGLAKQLDDLWLLAFELAHQWYGIGIATKDWSDLWLSEGVSAFLADAFMGQRFGKEAYERRIQHSRQIYNQLRAEGKDRALSDTGWTKRQEAAGEIPEYKGASFLYLVSLLVGDSAFWNGLRLYTSDQWGRAATSEDLQKAFDAVDTGQGTTTKGSAARRKKNPKNTPKPLDNLFDLWVYGIPNATPKKSR